MIPTHAVVSRRKAWALVACSVWLGACGDPELQVSIAMTASWNQDPLACGHASAPVRMTDLRFYVHDVHLLDSEGSPVALQMAPDGRRSPFKSEFVRGFELSDQERADLLAFLRSLIDETVLTDPAFSDPFSAAR